MQSVVSRLRFFIEQDAVATDIYFPGLADLWVAPDGSRYGLPKDWDTVAIVADQAKLDEAGVTVEEFSAATWNPDDGGTFQELIAKLSVDANGNRGDSPDFDPGNVVQYGWVGQTTGSVGEKVKDSEAVSGAVNGVGEKLPESVKAWSREVGEKAKEASQKALVEAGRVAKKAEVEAKRLGKKAVKAGSEAAAESVRSFAEGAVGQMKNPGLGGAKDWPWGEVKDDTPEQVAASSVDDAGSSAGSQK